MLRVSYSKNIRILYHQSLLLISIFPVALLILIYILDKKMFLYIHIYTYICLPSYNHLGCVCWNVLSICILYSTPRRRRVLYKVYLHMFSLHKELNFSKLMSNYIYTKWKKLTRLIWCVCWKLNCSPMKNWCRDTSVVLQNQRELLYFVCEWKENSFVVLQSINAPIDEPEFALHYTVYQEKPHLIS